jgi:hypothetical protein
MMPMENAHGPMSLYYIDYYIGVKCHLWPISHATRHPASGISDTISYRWHNLLNSKI